MSNIVHSEITNCGSSLPNRFPEFLSVVLSYLGARFDAEHELAPLAMAYTLSLCCAA